MWGGDGVYVGAGLGRRAGRGGGVAEVGVWRPGAHRDVNVRPGKRGGRSSSSRLCRRAPGDALLRKGPGHTSCPLLTRAFPYFVPPSLSPPLPPTPRLCVYVCVMCACVCHMCVSQCMCVSCVQYMSFEFNCRTSDNVEMILEGTFFWGEPLQPRDMLIYFGGFAGYRGGERRQEQSG